MVKIVNGQIVADDDPRARAPQQASVPRQQSYGQAPPPPRDGNKIFPRSNGALGMLSQHVTFMNEQIEYVFIILAVLALVNFGLLGLVILLGVLYVYKSSQDQQPAAAQSSSRPDPSSGSGGPRGPPPPQQGNVRTLFN